MISLFCFYKSYVIIYLFCLCTLTFVKWPTNLILHFAIFENEGKVFYGGNHYPSLSSYGKYCGPALTYGTLNNI